MTATLLEGIRIVDLGIWRPVPYATQLLVEMGADVIKVEPPGGDPIRVFPELFAVLNAGKRSVVIDLKSEDGVAEVVALVTAADAAIEGFRPGVAERLGVGYDALRAVNPAIVYCSISGYGADGPLAQVPGHDVNYQAYAGVLRPRGGEPSFGSLPVGDLGAGMMAAMATIAACFRARATGEGERIDVGISDVLATWTGAVGQLKPVGSDLPMNGLPGYGTYSTADGQWVTLGVLTEASFWSGLCRGLGLEHLDGLDLAHRIERKQELDSAVAEEIFKRDLAEVVAALRRQDVPVSPVLDRDEMLGLEHFRERGTVISDVDLLGEGRSIMGHPARYVHHPARSPGRVPGTGDDQTCSVDRAMTSPAHEWGLRSVPTSLEERYLSEGWWNDASLGSVIAGAVAEQPNQRMKVRSAVRSWEGTFGEVLEEAQRLAGALRARGIGAGDVVAFQLPNWKEAAVCFWAAAFLGAVVTPIVHFYGAKEVDYILRRTRVHALITTDHFGRNDYLTVLDAVRAQTPDLEHVIVLSEGPVPSWAERFVDVLDADPVTTPVAVDPDAPALVAYTSGTTADPKGVVHSHRTICFEIEQLSSMQTGNPPLLVGAPVGHGIGMLSGLLLPVHKREPIHLIDVWDPGAVLAAMIEDNIASGSGSTYFLSSLLDHPDITPAHLKLMNRIGLGGSAVPLAVTERMVGLGISPVRSYGSTEHPSTSGARHEEPLDKRMHTDGHALLGVELRIVNDAGADVAPGMPGEILSRGPDCSVGYTEPTLTATAFDEGGWFHTGDVGVLDEDGWLTIVDRIKDIIIRGGENISALEVEEQLLRLPGVAEAAAVAVPDERLGEHVCALVRLTHGAHAPDLAAVRAQFERAGLARQKWPEELRVVDDFPRTASGKVQKFLLRERLRAEA